MPRFTLRDARLCDSAIRGHGYRTRHRAARFDNRTVRDRRGAGKPAERTREWRIGHFLRQLPTEYEASVAQRANLLTDPRTHAYYESIRTVTRGRLASLDRLREVARLTLGRVPVPDWNMYYETKVPRSSAVDPATSGSTSR